MGNLRRTWLAAALLGCGGGGGDGGTGAVTPVPTSVSITTPPDSLLSRGATLQLTAVVRDAGNSVIAGAPVTWSSSNTSAATVNGTGLVTATVDGNSNVSTVITATAAAGVTNTYALNARQKLASLLVAPATANVAPGATQQLTATPRDANSNAIAGMTGVTFSSSNDAVASVNPNTGLVTAGAAAGGQSATITASLTADGATRTGTSVISVTAAPLTATVNTSGTSFVPSTPVDLKVTGTVTFNLSTFPHTVTFSAVAGAPANVAECTNCSADRTFNTVGTFPFICAVHGASMSGSIRVLP